MPTPLPSPAASRLCSVCVVAPVEVERRARSPWRLGLFRSLVVVCFLASLAISVGCQKVDVADEPEGAEQVDTISFESSSGVQQVLIPGGEFQMGSGVGDEGPRHAVVVSGFVMDVFEVRQEELAELQWPDASHFKDPNRPVEMIRWSEAAMVCNERSKREGLEPCYDDFDFSCDFAASGYRLPTEAEWEYAARAGASEAFEPTGEIPKLANKACYAGNSNESTEPVGSHEPNAWGLHDMLGNVAEWCHDIYSETYEVVDEPVVDPRGPEMGPRRVLRGGSWKSGAEICRPTARMADDPGIDDACFAQDRYGFRMVRRASEEELARLEASGAEHDAADIAE